MQAGWASLQILGHYVNSLYAILQDCLLRFGENKIVLKLFKTIME